MGYLLLSTCIAWPTLSKSATTTALDVSEVLLLVFGAVLTIGALGEYKKFPRLLRASLATFELLVVIGIAGELLADGAIFVFSRHLQTLSEGEYATLNNEAGIARREAGDAILDAGTARGDAAKANERAGKANERASKNEEEAARLRKEAEHERLLRFQLEGKVAWRKLSKAQQNALTSRLFLFKRMYASVEYSDMEGSSFADDISLSLRAAGWQTYSPGWGTSNSYRGLLPSDARWASA